MKLFLLCQDQNFGYDTYDSIIVAAKNEYDAQEILPRNEKDWTKSWSIGWAKHPSAVEVHLIGTAVSGTKKGVICASFNAG